MKCYVKRNPVLQILQNKRILYEGGARILNMEIGNVMHNGNHFYLDYNIRQYVSVTFNHVFQLYFIIRFPDVRDPMCFAPSAPISVNNITSGQCQLQTFVPSLLDSIMLNVYHVSTDKPISYACFRS